MRFRLRTIPPHTPEDAATAIPGNKLKATIAAAINPKTLFFMLFSNQHIARTPIDRTSQSKANYQLNKATFEELTLTPSLFFERQK